MGDLSAHFSRREFACHGAGHAGHQDHASNPSPVLVERLERLRAIVGKPIRIVSGCRCAWWNAHQGGKRHSQHLVCKAADLPPGTATVQQAADAGFVGIGRKGRWAVHVDVREGPPARWVY